MTSPHPWATFPCSARNIANRVRASSRGMSPRGVQAGRVVVFPVSSVECGSALLCRFCFCSFSGRWSFALFGVRQWQSHCRFCFSCFFCGVRQCFALPLLFLLFQRPLVFCPFLECGSGKATAAFVFPVSSVECGSALLCRFCLSCFFCGVRQCFALPLLFL